MTMIYHLALESDWNEAVKSSQSYYPPTFEQDGMTHAAPDTKTLIQVANQFYRGVLGPWCCLTIDINVLNRVGIKVRFEPAAPVGDQDDHFSGSEAVQFPHIYGGIPDSAVVYIGTVERDVQGNFLAVSTHD